MRIVIIAQLRFPAEQMAAVRAAVAELRPATLAEDGCLKYAFSEDLDEPGVLRVSEIWASRAALDAHGATAHVAAWRATAARLGMTEREVRVFTVAGEETL